MPYTVDIDKMTQKAPQPGEQMQPLIAMDLAKPPVKQIPHLEYPRVMYMHPKEPYKITIHRNAQHEIVHEERIPSEHLTRVVADEKELKKALAEGWVKEPYVAKAPEDPNANLYKAS